MAESPYSYMRVSRYFTLYFIPLFPTSTLGHYVRCDSCKGELPEVVLQCSREEILLVSHTALDLPEVRQSKSNLAGDLSCVWHGEVVSTSTVALVTTTFATTMSAPWPSTRSA